MALLKKLFLTVICVFTVIFVFTWVNHHLQMSEITIRGRMMRHFSIKGRLRKIQDSNRPNGKFIPRKTEDQVQEPIDRKIIPAERKDAVVAKGVPQKVKDLVEKESTTSKTKYPDEEMACKLPHIDPFDKEVLPFIEHPRKFDCEKIQEEFSYVEGKLVYLNNTLLQSYKKETKRRIKCFWRYLYKKEGHKNGVKETKLVRLKKDEPVKFPTSGMVQVECFERKNGKQKHAYFNIHVQTQPIKKPFQKPTEDQLSVYLLIFESMATARFKRHMKSVKKLLAERKTFFFEGYNKVADNTYVNLVPMLTGMRANNGQSDMKDEFHRKYPKINSYDEVDAFLWKSFSKRNYTTAFLENAFELSTFGFGKKVGFKNAKPFDYFYHPYFVQHGVLWKHNTKFCFGNEPFIPTQLKLAGDLFDWYGNKEKLFVMNVITEPGHDDENDIERADDLVANSLRRLFNKGSFNRTFVILMGDHGPRYGDVRLTRNGYFEERLTFLSLVAPSWFHTKHPHVVKNLEVNQRRLTTPFDVHQTLKDILDGDYQKNQLLRRPSNKRGVSLFDEIPLNRTCPTAGIPQLYCPCYKPKDTPINTPLSKELAELMVKHINSMLSKRKLDVKCATLKLDSIRQVTIMDENIDGILYKVVVQATPGRGLFEGLATKNIKGVSFHDGAVSRLNKYGRQGSCIQSGFQKYCYCKSR